MDDMKEIELSQKAIDYLRHWLDEGGLTLSKLLLENVDLNKGRITTSLPENADLKKTYEFNNNIVPYPPKSEWKRHVGKDGVGYYVVRRYSFESYCIETIHSFLKSENSICIMEEYSAVLEGPYEAEFRPKVLTYRGVPSDAVFKGKDDEVYHVLRGKNISEQEIFQTMGVSECPYPPLICHLICLSNNEREFKTGRAVTKSELKALATGTEKLIIGAYDGDAYLVWHKLSENKTETARK
jgi:hypothetical protein